MITTKKNYLILSNEPKFLCFIILAMTDGDYKWPRF